MNIINTCYTFFGCNYDIFSQFLFNSWLKKIYNFYLNRNVKQQSPSPLPPSLPPSLPPKRPRAFLQTKSINDNTYFTATLFIFIWSNILVISSNVTLSNHALTLSEFIRYDRWLRYVSVVDYMTLLMFGKYHHILNRADKLYCIILLF